MLVDYGGQSMAFCTTCGAQQTSDHEAFCPSCGNRHTAAAGQQPPSWGVVPPPPPPPAAPPTMMPPAMQQPPSMPPPGMSPPGLAPAGWQPPVSGSGGGKGTWLRVGGIVGLVLAISAVGIVGWRVFSPHGGAGSPEDAVENLMNAAADQDPVGVLDMVSPAEIEGMDDVYDAARERAKDEDLVDGDGVTDAVELEFSDLSFDVDELSDDIARVTLDGGRYKVSWDPAKLPDRLDFLKDESTGESESGDIADLFYDEQPSVMTVKVDGRWYVSLIGTSADYTYRSAEREADYSDYDLASPDWDLAAADVDPITGDTPEDVIANLVDAVNSGKSEQLLANLPEDLVKPLRPYVPVIDELQREGGWAEGEIGLSVSADDLDLSTEDLDDDLVKVVIESGTFTGTAFEEGYDNDTGSLAVEGDCVDVFEEDYLGDSGCASDIPIVKDLGLTDLFFVVAKVDDGYQLDPGATLVEYASTAIDGLSSDVVEKILDELRDEVEGDGDYYDY
ncbi:zinc ribbon domain-containing protein [Nocardioides humilatus]|uniref:Zinc ribbon domain-containing protein n=1 Tax=Nocardioides humilatus TaxID=2607660 RepID=A0A5B1LM53_9ACTN|nr:zinc ribbon domain-containing protein [Nocardioides humilatus]KAA1421556.1 zinc ribbon domain-containing protein [Nocardioides humilatus]